MSSFLPKRLFQVMLLSGALLSVFATSGDEARFNNLGHQMICMCGCNQILLECNHVGCPLSDGMRNELAAGLQRGDSDDLILQAFVQKYGPTILAAPTATGFNRIAWIMPFLVLILGFASALLIVRSWKSRPGGDSSGGPTSTGFQDEIRRDTEL